MYTMFNFFKRNPTENSARGEALNLFIEEEKERGQHKKTEQHKAALNAFLKKTPDLVQAEVFEKDAEDIKSQENTERHLARLHTKLSSFTEAASVFSEKDKDSTGLQYKVDAKVYGQFFSDKGDLGQILELLSLAENLLIFIADSRKDLQANIQAADKYIAEAEKKYQKLASQRSVMAFVGRYAQK